ncbi:hypothetical protein ACFQH6_07595 [Halobacteriaceae archaeon GCM10025711]
MVSALKTGGVLALVLLLLVQPGYAVAGETTSGSGDVNVTWSPVVLEHNGTSYVWFSDVHTVNVSFENQNAKYYEACLGPPETANDTEEAYACKEVPDQNKTVEMSFELAELPESAIGRQDFTVVVDAYNLSGPTRIHERTIPLYVMEKTGDVDKDGLTNQEERKHNTSLILSDTDKDGFRDGEEINTYDTDPLLSDSDGDNLTDKQEIEQGTDPLDPDTDDDGVPDGVEVEHNMNPLKVDSDGDLLDDRTELKWNTGPSTRFMPALLLVGAASVVALGLYVRPRRHPPAPAEMDGPGNGTAPTAAQNQPEPTPIQNGVNVETPTASETDEVYGPIPTEDVLTNEEQVLNLLGANGGRLKQSAIVEETDWSKAKVSRVLSKMEGNDQITKIQVGRENVVTVKGEEPDGARSPFEGD